MLVYEVTEGENNPPLVDHDSRVRHGQIVEVLNETVGLRVALNAEQFNHAEVGPDDLLAKIGARCMPLVRK